MKLSGVIPLRNALRLGYPFGLAIQSLQRVCDETVVLVDPTSDDETMAWVRRLGPDRIVESVWDMGNHDGDNDEIAKQTAIACAAATGDWILSMQADELFHEHDAASLRLEIEQHHAATTRTDVPPSDCTALAYTRIYFYGSLRQYRTNWTVQCIRAVKRDHWLPDPRSGAMQFIPSGPGNRWVASQKAPIFHYSRVGDPALIAQRVQQLDRFYHAPDDVLPVGTLPPYDFALRRRDTYVKGAVPEADPEAELVPYPIEQHPQGVREFYGE